MSKYCWERGSIVIPDAEWKTVRDSIVGAYNTRQKQLHEMAARAYRRLVELKKTAGAAAVSEGAYEALKKSGFERDIVALMERDEDGAWTISGSITSREAGTAKLKLSSPKRKAFAYVPPTKVVTLQVGEARIAFDHRARTITWTVPDNNHAVERARSHPIGQTLFKALASVKWTRGSGGYITGNDELSRDSSEEGDGANYVTYRVGPLGERKDPLARLMKKVQKQRKAAVKPAVKQAEPKKVAPTSGVQQSLF